MGCINLGRGEGNPAEGLTDFRTAESIKFANNSYNLI